MVRKDYIETKNKIKLFKLMFHTAAVMFTLELEIKVMQVKDFISMDTIL